MKLQSLCSHGHKTFFEFTCTCGGMEGGKLKYELSDERSNNFKDTGIRIMVGDEGSLLFCTPKKELTLEVTEAAAKATRNNTALYSLYELIDKTETKKDNIPEAIDEALKETEAEKTLTSSLTS